MSHQTKRKFTALCAAAIGAVIGLAAFSPQMASASDGHSPSDVCIEARTKDWFDPAWVCIVDGRGLALALPNQAGELANALDGAHANFEEHFVPARYSFAVVGTPSLPQEASAFLKMHGFLALPWITKSARGDLMRQSVERQVNAQTKGMSEERRAVLLAQALEQLGAGEPGDTLPPSNIELGALAHEAGHLLFRDFYDGDNPPDKSAKQYGSSAPDWIDEIAAILNENEELTEGRYASARARIKDGESPNPFALKQFFEMEHPSMRAAEALRARSRADGGSVVIALSGEEAEQFLKKSGGNPAEFYLQARLFADFLLEVTGEKRIFQQIAMGIKNDGSFAAWLADNHANLGLGGDVASLEVQFERWIEARFTKDVSN